MKTDLLTQFQKLIAAFPGLPYGYNGAKALSTRAYELFPGLAGETQGLVVISHKLISTKALFTKIDLGRKEDNTWFLDMHKMYDVPLKHVVCPPVPHLYFLESVDTTNTSLSEEITERNDPYYKNENGPYPLTLHECASLLFQFPELLTDPINGVQAYGSRFGKDDTLELYKKGNAGNAFLKLAREEKRYEEKSKLIPTTVARHVFPE